jgi:YD repeat-containing protein
MSRVATLLLGIGLAVPGLLRADVDTAWVRRYDGPAHGVDMAEGIAVDSAGNVYVTGRSASDTSGNPQYLDFVTIKYYPNGDTAWVRRADFGGKDIPSGLGVDAQGNVYVTGTNNDSRMVTVKYDSAGHQKWAKLYGSRALCDDLALDQDGNVIICGGDTRASTDCVLIKYRPNGDTAWTRFYDWAGYDDDLDALAATSNGEICAVGFCSDTSPGGNILALKYDSAGNWQWATSYDGPQHGADWPTAVAVDGAGNSYVAAVSDNGYGTTTDYLTIKYDSLGETLWTRRYDGPAHDWDQARAVAVNDGGRIYITGYSTGQGADYDYATIAYSSAGDTLWTRRYNGPANGQDEARAIAVDDRGQVCVTGSSYGGLSTHFDCATVMYDSLGDTLWTRRFSTPGQRIDEGRCVVLDDKGSVYVAGKCDALVSGGDILVIKYIQSGGVAEERHASAALRLTVSTVPNPFAARTEVRFAVPNSELTRVRVLDVSGRTARTFQCGLLAAGQHSLVWDRTDDQGVRVPTGVYMVVLDAAGTGARAKVTVLE